MRRLSPASGVGTNGISSNAIHGNAPHDGEEEGSSIDLQKTAHTTSHESGVNPTPAIGPGAGRGVQAESNLARRSAAGRCKWDAGASAMFAAHAILIALSLFLHPLRECHPVGVSS